MLLRLFLYICLHVYPTSGNLCVGTGLFLRFRNQVRTRRGPAEYDAPLPASVGGQTREICIKGILDKKILL